ncbi:hypothetical protein BC830DRAFT_1165367 [Chytriomyces sp. MP71]|nr:hypothetical protein BC830DRAFT_1165367 [Chytriomyces sp. MP71]
MSIFWMSVSCVLDPIRVSIGHTVAGPADTRYQVVTDDEVMPTGSSHALLGGDCYISPKRDAAADRATLFLTEKLASATPAKVEAGKIIPKFKIMPKKLEMRELFVYTDVQPVQIWMIQVFPKREIARIYAETLTVEAFTASAKGDEDEEEELAARFTRVHLVKLDGAVLDKYCRGFNDRFHDSSVVSLI